MFVNFELINKSEYEKFWENLKSGQYVSSDFKRLKKNGDEVWLQATYNPILDNEGRVVRIMKIATDITEKILQSLEIDKKNTYLEHAAKILRHDMHSGINTYIPRGISSLERRLKPEDIENLKIEAPLKMIKEGLRHTQKVYSGVYEFTNLVKKDAVLNKKMCNLKQILESYLQSTAYKSQVLISDLGELEVNESLFCTAIDNLIRNGLKYNDSNTKVVTIKIEDDILIIQDNGRGLTQEEFLQLSKPYARKEGQKESGTGLGLNICVAILHEHGFEISCEKNEIGTKMKIDFK
jgi:signal transduction histidine kinase